MEIGGALARRSSVLQIPPDDHTNCDHWLQITCVYAMCVVVLGIRVLNAVQNVDNHDVQL